MLVRNRYFTKEETAPALAMRHLDCQADPAAQWLKSHSFEPWIAYCPWELDWEIGKTMGIYIYISLNRNIIILPMGIILGKS
jgi:hypothetical protein